MQPKYEMILIAITYNLASIAKMGYKDIDNNGIFVKVHGAQDENDEGDEREQTQDSASYSWLDYGCFGGDSAQSWSH